MPRQRALPCRAPAVDPEDSARLDRHGRPDAPASPSPSVVPHCGIRTVQCKRRDRGARDALPRADDRAAGHCPARRGQGRRSRQSTRRGAAPRQNAPSLIGRRSAPHHSGAPRSGLASKILRSQVTIMLGFLVGYRWRSQGTIGNSRIHSDGPLQRPSSPPATLAAVTCVWYRRSCICLCPSFPPGRSLQTPPSNPLSTPS